MTLVSHRLTPLSRGFFICLLLLVADEATAAWNCGAKNADCFSVFVVHDSWHAALVLRKGDLNEKTIPEVADFPNAEMIEFSWGDQDYFPEPNAGVFAALKAAFWSAGSVLHLVGFRGAAKDFYRGAEIIELRLTKDAFLRLLAFVAVEFTRAEPSLPAKTRPGLYSYSRFYRAAGKFSFARNCNTWVAEALNHAGLPIHPASVITAGNLGGQLADLPARK